MPDAAPRPEITFHRFDPFTRIGVSDKERLVEFLHEHLDRYGDPKPAIRKAVEYAVKERTSFGGFVLEARMDGRTVGAVVINKTGMSGYIPENVLVYIAVDAARRGHGIGAQLMRRSLDMADGDVALHVEANNPAKRLYERMGFTNPYLEMRYKAG